MPQQTQNYKLNMWLSTDRFILSELNSNFTTIDQTLGTMNTAIQELQTKYESLNQSHSALSGVVETMQSTLSTLDTMQKSMNSSLTSLTSKYESLNKTVEGLASNSKIKFTTWSPSGIYFTDSTSSAMTAVAPQWPQQSSGPSSDNQLQTNMVGITFTDMGLPSTVNLEAALVFGMASGWTVSAYHETKSSINAVDFPLLILPTFTETSTYRSSKDYLSRARGTNHVIHPLVECTSAQGAQYVWPVNGSASDAVVNTHELVHVSRTTPISYTPVSNATSKKGSGGRGIWFGYTWYNQAYYMIQYPYAVWLWYTE